MADVVGSKFGSRKLVQLPPVNFSGMKTAEVQSLAQPYEANRFRDGGRHDNGHGNLVQYTGGGQYQGSNAPPLQYTNHALQQQQQPPPPPPPQANPAPVASNPPVNNQPQPRVNNAGSNDQHIYYGPNGEVISGPQAGAQFPGPEVFQNDFVVDAILDFGRVRSMTKLDSGVQFPKLPDYLLRHLIAKYGQYRRTVARITLRRGQFNVHGMPQIPAGTMMPPPPGEYPAPAVMPVAPAVMPVPMPSPRLVNAYPEYEYPYRTNIMPVFPTEDPDLIPIYPDDVDPGYRYAYDTPPTRSTTVDSRDDRRYDYTRGSTRDPVQRLRWQRTPTL